MPFFTIVESSLRKPILAKLNINVFEATPVTSIDPIIDYENLKYYITDNSYLSEVNNDKPLIPRGVKFFPSHEEAEQFTLRFIKTYNRKYPKSCTKLTGNYQIYKTKG